MSQHEAMADAGVFRESGLHLQGCLGWPAQSHARCPGWCAPSGAQSRAPGAACGAGLPPGTRRAWLEALWGADLQCSAAAAAAWSQRAPWGVPPERLLPAAAAELGWELPARQPIGSAQQGGLRGSSWSACWDARGTIVGLQAACRLALPHMHASCLVGTSGPHDRLLCGHAGAQTGAFGGRQVAASFGCHISGVQSCRHSLPAIHLRQQLGIGASWHAWT